MPLPHRKLLMMRAPKRGDGSRHYLPLSSDAKADQGCRKRRNRVSDWSEIRCRFPPKSPAAFDRNQVPVCSDFCRRRDPETGRIVEAFGFDLSPLALRYDEFIRVAAAAKIERDRMKTAPAPQDARRARHPPGRRGDRMVRKQEKGELHLDRTLWKLREAKWGKDRRSRCGV
jgi:hypothetical protein